MTDNFFQCSDEAIIEAAKMLGDEKRLALIAKVIGSNTTQSQRVVEILMAIHLHERSKARDAVSWALGTNT